MVSVTDTIDAKKIFRDMFLVSISTADTTDVTDSEFSFYETICGAGSCDLRKCSRAKYVQMLFSRQ